MGSKNIRIPTRISPDILDTIGRSFKFNHGKGAAEWLKNSLDNYLRLYEIGQETIPGNWPVLLNLIDSQSQKNGPNLMLIDFGGTNLENIENFFLYWGDTSAATLGGKASRAAVTGGHGNGGKFYMREMWRSGARFLTWNKGLSTSLIVDKEKSGTTGEWEFREKITSWQEALALALSEKEGLQGSSWAIKYIRDLLPQIAKDLDNEKRGFTTIIGRKAVQIHSSNDVVRGGRWISQKLVDDILEAQQARRPVRELNIGLFINGEEKLRKLSFEEIPVDEEWQVEKITLPKDMFGNETKFKNLDILGTLSIKKSTQQLTGRYKHHNMIVVNDTNNNPVAFYSIGELPIPGYSPIMSFIFGELDLLFPGAKDLVTNDREKLVDSPVTRTILNWVGATIWAHIQIFEKKQQDHEKNKELKLADLLNNALNQHARRFLKELETEIMVDYVYDENSGGLGIDGEEPEGKKGKRGKPRRNREGTRGGNGKGGEKAQEGTSSRKNRPKFPEVLLSGFHPDPSRNDGLSKSLTERHPPIHQDDIDRQHNIWWINTDHPYSKKAISNGSVDGHAFKTCHLFLFVQVVQVESLRLLQRRQAELGLDIVENELNDISNKFLSQLPIDLANSLLR